MEDAIKIFEEILKNGKLNSIEIDYLLKKYLPKYLAYSFKLFWHGGYDKLWNDYRIRNFIIKNNNYIITEIYNLSYFLTDSMFSSFIMKLTEKEVIKLSHNFFKKLIIEDFKEEWLLYTNLDEKSRLEIALKFDKFQYMKDILDKKIEFK